MLKTLLKKSSTYFVGSLISKTLSTVTFIVYARTLLPQKFGEYIFFITLIQVITYFADAGLNQWYQKQYEKTDDKRKLFQRVISTRTYALIVSILLTIGVSLVMSLPLLLLVIFLFTLIPEALNSTIDGYYLKKGMPLRTSLKNGSKMIILLAGWFLFSKIFSVETALILYLIASVTTLVWYFPWRQLEHFSPLPPDQIIRTLQSSFPYAFLILTSFLYSRGDFVVIKTFKGSASLGLYDSAYRFLDSISLLPTALSQNLFPISSQKNGIKLRQLIIISSVMIGVGSVISLMIFISSGLLITTLLGPAYLAAIPLLRIFSLVIFLFFINAPLSTVVQSSSVIRKFLPYGFGNTIANIVLNILFVPLYGVQAAAWIMVFTEVTGLFINIKFVRTIYNRI